MCRRLLSCGLCLLLCLPAPMAWAGQGATSFFNKDGTLSPSAVTSALQALEAFEKQATVLMSTIALQRAELAWWLTEAIWQDVEPIVQEEVEAWLAKEGLEVIPTGDKAPTPEWVPPQPNASSQQTNPPSVASLAATPSQVPTVAMVEPVVKLKGLWATLGPQEQQLAALEMIIDQYRQLLDQVWPKVKDNSAVLAAGLLRFAQLNIHTTTRRMMQSGVETPLPDVATLPGCQDGLLGSLAFLEALQAAVDFKNADRQAAAQSALHTQHACLDISTSLRHEIAYVAAIEHEEQHLAKSGLAAWYPLLATANVPVILTLADGKQSLGPTPFWNWLRLNKTVLLNGAFNDPGLFAFDRSTGAMVKLDFCPGKGAYQAPSAAKAPQGAAPAPETWWANGKFMPDEPVPAVAGTTGLSLPYNKGPVQDPAIVMPQAIQPDQFYTPYGVAWSGNPQHMCSADHFLQVVALQGECLQPAVFLDRLGDATAWGFGNCTLAEFVADGLRCRQPLTLCEDPKLFPALAKKAPPAVPFQIGKGNPNLLECLVANVQPAGDALLTCARQNPLTGSGGGTSGSGIAASDSEWSGGGRGSGDSEWGSGGVRLFTPGSQFCGNSMAPLDEEGGDQGTQTAEGDDGGGDDDGDGGDGGDDKEKNDDDDTQEQSDDPKVTTSPDGKTRTYDFPPQNISGGGRQQQQAGSPNAAPPLKTQQQGGPAAGGHTPSGGKGGTGGPSGGNGRTGTPSGPTTPGKHFDLPSGGSKGEWIPQKGGPTYKEMKGVLPKAHTTAAEKAVLDKHFGGSWDKVKEALGKSYKVAKQVLQKPGVQQLMFESLNAALAKMGRPGISQAIFEAQLQAFLNNEKLFGVHAAYVVPVSSYHDYFGTPKGATKPGFLGLTDDDKVPGILSGKHEGLIPMLYMFPSMYMLPCLANPRCHGLMIQLLVHEGFHAFTEQLVWGGVLPLAFAGPLPGKPKGNVDTFEHYWIYLMTRHLEVLLPTNYWEKGLIDLQSSFDPAQFPGGTPGVKAPDPYAPGEIAISIGPTVPDPTSPTGSKSRYPNGGPGSCDDPMSCGGGCTVGQAQATAFATCAVDVIAGEGGGPGANSSGQLAGGGWTDPTPLADDNGPIPPCSGAVGGGKSSSGDCKVIDCPADNPNCCAAGGQGAAPWALDPAVIMQNCFAQFCGSEQPNCPCGALMGAEGFSTPAESLMQKGKGPDPKVQPAAQP